MNCKNYARTAADDNKSDRASFEHFSVQLKLVCQVSREAENTQINKADE